jgi:RluA family pseudouridine synthase
MKPSAPYTIIWEDAAFLAVNKAAGIPVCPERWEEGAVPLTRLLETERGAKYFVCHRLDRETSGLVVFAKTSAAHKALSSAFEKRLVQKKYTVILHGRPAWRETDCALPLIPDGNKKHLTVVDTHRGKPSFTRFRALFSVGKYTVAEAEPRTGRAHQIRVHASALGHPVVCDMLYGPSRRSGKPEAVYLSAFKHGWRGDKYTERPLLMRLGLHAAALTLPEECVLAPPRTLEAPLPKDMSSLIAQMTRLSGTNERGSF